MITKETEYIKSKIQYLDRNERIKFLQQSNLNDRELKLLSMRLIQGISLKDCAENFQVEVNTISKQQIKAIKKLYDYIKSK